MDAVSADHVLAVTASGTSCFNGAGRASYRASLNDSLTDVGFPPVPRQADEQSLAGVAAMVQAMGRRESSTFRDWGVLAAPRWPGAGPMATALKRFPQDGAWGVSPHVIPHCSLHSLAGMLSLTFGLRGPNCGVGGVAGGEGEAFTALCGFLDPPRPFGMWVVLTGWDAGPTPVCRGVALALTTSNVASSEGMVVAPSGPGRQPLAAGFSLEGLFHALRLPEFIPNRCRWALPGGGLVTWWRSAGAARMAA